VAGSAPFVPVFDAVVPMILFASAAPQS